MTKLDKGGLIILSLSTIKYRKSSHRDCIGIAKHSSSFGPLGRMQMSPKSGGTGAMISFMTNATSGRENLIIATVRDNVDMVQVEQRY